MEYHPPETLEDVVPFIQEHLLPLIQQSVEVCKKSYWDDPFNDSYTFGTQLWRNAWNRLKATATYEDCPFEKCGKGNEYKLKIGRFVVRNHRIDPETQLPNGAKAAKAAAHEQLELFENLGRKPDEIDNIIIAIDADTEDGLQEVFLAPIVPLNRDSTKYTWEEGQKFTVYQAHGAQPSTVEAMNINDHRSVKEVEPEVVVKVDTAKHGDSTKEVKPAENEANVVIEMDKYRAEKKKPESEQEK